MPILLSEPIQIKKLQLKNRAVVSFNCTKLADLNGKPTDKLINFYGKIAETGPSLVIVESASIQKNHRSFSKQLNLQSHENMNRFAAIAERVRSKGAIPAIRITHPGVLALTPERAFRLSPSGIDFKGKNDPLGKELTFQEIQKIISDFVQGAISAWDAGFEAIEIQGGDGELLHQFISPKTNKRFDEFGLEYDNSFRLAMEVVTKIKEAVPDLLLFYRIPMRDYLPGGLTMAKSLKLAKMLANCKVDAFHLTGGIPSNQYGADSIFGKDSPDCVFKDEAIELRKLSIPVIYSGNVFSQRSAANILSHNYADMINFDKALLRSPEFIYASMQNRKATNADLCLRCNDCQVLFNACPDERNEGFWTRGQEK